MAITLPLPLRVAAGLVATGIDLVKSLPEDIPALPVTLVGNAMRLSMKFQQEITSLATRGDELLGGVIGAPQENPPWAKFDDDEPAKPAPTRSKPAAEKGTTPKADTPGGGTRTDKPAGAGVTAADKSKADSAGAPAQPDLADRNQNVAAKRDESEQDTGQNKPEQDGPAQTEPAQTETGHDDSGEHTLKTPTTTAAAPADTTAMEAALEVSDALVEQALEVAEPDAVNNKALETDVTSATEASDTTVDPADTDDRRDSVPAADANPALSDDSKPERASQQAQTAGPAKSKRTTESANRNGSPSREDQEQVSNSEPASDAVADGPAALPGYGSMTLAQVRGHLRDLSADDVGVLLRYEQDSDNRPPFLTLLSNRLVTLDAQNR